MKKIENILKDLDVELSDLSIIEEAFSSYEEIIEFLEECKEKNIKGYDVFNQLPEFSGI